MRKFNRPLAALAGVGLSILVSLGAPIGSAVTAVAAPATGLAAAEVGGATLANLEDTENTAGGNSIDELNDDKIGGTSTPDDHEITTLSDGDGAVTSGSNSKQSDSGKNLHPDSDSAGSMMRGVVTENGETYHMPDSGRPYLKFVIIDPVTNNPIEKPGSAVVIQGPRDGSTSSTLNRWGSAITVLDCTTGEDACPQTSFDQDSRPGHFAVDRLTAAGTQLEYTKRYRIGASTTAPMGYKWATPSLTGGADNAANVTAFITPVGTGNANNINTAAEGQWVLLEEDPASNYVHDFTRTSNNEGPPELQIAPSLKWDVRQDGSLIGGSTVQVQGPRSGTSTVPNWNGSYNVVDCEVGEGNVCPTDSMDQDPVPGKFEVFSLISGATYTPIVNTNRYQLVPANSVAPLSLIWVNSAAIPVPQGSGVNAATPSWAPNASFDLGTLAVAGAPSLVWQVTKDGDLVGGATVRVQRPNNANNNWQNTNYDVVDCIESPCAADSMDQDPTAGAFRVYKLTSGTTSVDVSNARRYRIQPLTAPRNTNWLSSTSTWQEGAGSFASPGGWSTSGPIQYAFKALTLQEAPNLTWEVRHQTGGSLVGGATVKVHGPRSGTNTASQNDDTANWGNEYRVQDCVIPDDVAPRVCAATSMDQDPDPGKFKVFTLMIGTSSGDFSSHQVSKSSRYGILPFVSPVGSQWVTSPSSWINVPWAASSPAASRNTPLASSWTGQAYSFESLKVRDGAYLQWSVRDDQGSLVPGATVEVQGPRQGPASDANERWNTSGGPYYVTDCTVDPCHPDSMDQDPTPGVFKVDTLRGLSGYFQTASDVDRARYRIRPIGSIPQHRWETSTTTWNEIPAASGTNNHNTPNPDNWPENDLGYVFADLKVKADGLASTFCSPSDGRYYTLSRSTTNSSVSTIRKLAPNELENAISTTNDLIVGSQITAIGTGQTANALGVTPTGVFYFTGQYSGGNDEQARNTTIYRFDPERDNTPYPVLNMDLLSPTTGTIVSGDAVIYEGREEFYFAYYSDAPTSAPTIGGQRPIRFHLYRFSMGNGDRTGEVRHIDVPRAQNWTLNGGGGFNGDFAFDAQNNLLFIISSAQGRLSSGSVAASEFQPQPSAHVLADVTEVQGTADTLLSAANTNLAQINGITYTKSGRAIMQRSSGNSNFIADMPGLGSASSQRTFSGGNFVDLASCDTPTNITVEKFLDGNRYDADDQFTLSAQRIDGVTENLGSPVTTTGDDSGMQVEKVGPFALTTSGTFKAEESIDPSSNSDKYSTSYACYALDDRGVNAEGIPYVEPFLIGRDRSLEFDLSGEGRPDGVVPGASLVCIFTNRHLSPDLKVSKTSEPLSGTAVAADDTVRYILTFDNTNGSLETDQFAYVDWLHDVLDDAEFVEFAENQPFEYRSSTGGVWVADPDGVIGNATEVGEDNPHLSFEGTVPAGELRQVRFQVKVRANSDRTDERLTETAPLKGFLLRNYLTDAEAEGPPETCEIVEGELPMCTEHPIQAWTVSKSSQPVDGSRMHKGGNTHYRIVAQKLNDGTEINDLIFTDDLTNVFKSAGFAPDAAVPGGALPRGIYFFDAAGNSLGSVTGVGQNGAVNATVTAAYLGATGVPDPIYDLNTQRWTITSPSVIVPSNAVRAEMWFAVQAGESPEDIPETWPSDTEPANGAMFSNYVTAIASDQPLNCITGVTLDADPDVTADPDFPKECQVTHELRDSFFTIRKDASGPAVDAVNVTKNGAGQTVVTDSAYGDDVTGMWNMIGHEFSLRDRSDGPDTAPENASRFLCHTEYNPNNPGGWDGTFDATSDDTGDWGENSTTLQAIKEWNNSHSPALPLCGTFYAQTNAGGQTGRWRAENMPAGNYWLVETKAPNEQISLDGEQTRPVPGVQLLAQAIPFTVWPDGATIPTWNNGQSQEGLNQLDVLAGDASGGAEGTDRPSTQYTNRCEPRSDVGSRNTACVNPTGYLLVIKDTGPTPLPLTGGTNWAQILGLAGGIVLAGAVGGTVWWRRRQTPQTVGTRAAEGTLVRQQSRRTGGGRHAR